MINTILFDYFGVLARYYGRCDEEIMKFVEQELYGKYRLAVFSNIRSGDAREMLGDKTKLFDEIVLSGELGYSKPDIRAYLETAKQLAEFPSNCLLIDDSGSNVAGAARAGMESIRYKSVGQLRRDLAKYDILTP